MVAFILACTIRMVSSLLRSALYSIIEDNTYIEETLKDTFAEFASDLHKVFEKVVTFMLLSQQVLKK